MITLSTYKAFEIQRKGTAFSGENLRKMKRFL